MFIHIGGDTVVSTKEVITIIDHQSVKTSKISRKFIQDERKNKVLVEDDMEEAKSYVITKDAIYCSPISSLTLKRRAQFVNSLDQFPSVQTDLEELTE
ncbi:extracellular matrix regulator RemB [Brevibacillus sp. SYSU BS000544]|uniref:extracellular matrix regulator RemB n=1 Tax=Brevibacillus sp. SYSU BS000544 TaxID=3416443 RepID=UPI003CE51A39